MTNTLAEVRLMAELNEPLPESVYIDADGEVQLKPGRSNVQDIRSEPNPDPSFSTILPTLQLAYNSSAFGPIQNCLRQYELSRIRGYSSPHESADLRFGIEAHSAFEVYDRTRATGASHKTALRSSIHSALTSTWNSELNRPWESGDSLKNRDSLIRTTVDYLDHFEHDSLETVILANGEAAVEYPFYLELEKISSTGEHFALYGHIDRLVRFQGRVWVTDRKTTKRALNKAYFAQYSPDTQISLYAYAGKIVYGEEIAGIIIDGIQILANGTQFQRAFIERKESTLNEWMRDAEYYIEQAEHAAQHNYWPQNAKACGRVYEDPNTGKLSYGCPFRPVCGSAPEVRQILLDLNYVKRSRTNVS